MLLAAAIAAANRPIQPLAGRALSAVPAAPAMPAGLFVASASRPLEAVLAASGLARRPVTPGLQLAL